MKLSEKIALLGGTESEWFHSDSDDLDEIAKSDRKMWRTRVTLALALQIGPSDDEAKVAQAKERVVKALGRSMFIRAVLAGYDFGLTQEVRNEILKNKEEYLKKLGVTLKREGESTGRLEADSEI